MIEYLIWFCTPILLIILLGFVLSKYDWFNIKAMLVNGFVLGLAGVLFAPTSLCSNACVKYGWALINALTINTLFIFLAIAFLYIKNRK